MSMDSNGLKSLTLPSWYSLRLPVWFQPVGTVSADHRVIGIVAALIGGHPIFKEAFENIVERKMTMNSR